jgi:L-aminopeptidase/D-esterase-like protein
MGPGFACKSGIGSAVMDLGDGLLVGALMVVNAVGDVLDEHGALLAGARLPPEGTQFANVARLLPSLARLQPARPGSNTVIGVVATSAYLTKDETNKIAQMAHDGLARAVNPAHTMHDGDTIFALATGSAGTADVSIIGALAAEATAQAIRRAVRAATPLAGLPAGSSIAPDPDS